MSGFTRQAELPLGETISAPVPGGRRLQLRSILPLRLTAQGRCALFPSLTLGAPLGREGLLRCASKHQPIRAEKEHQMNSVNLVGRLTKDPELTERGETKVCDLRIAVNGQGEDATALHRRGGLQGARPRPARSTSRRDRRSPSRVPCATRSGRPRRARSAPSTRCWRARSSSSTPSRSPRTGRTSNGSKEPAVQRPGAEGAGPHLLCRVPFGRRPASWGRDGR